MQELIAIVQADQVRRSVQRAVGRAASQRKAKTGSRKEKVVLQRLEQLGFDPQVCDMLRKSNPSLSEALLIRKLAEKGLL